MPRCYLCGGWTPRHDFPCMKHDEDRDAIVCTCPIPLVDGLGECQSCHRKPAHLLGVVGRDALVAAGARVVSREGQEVVEHLGYGLLAPPLMGDEK